MEGGHSTQHRAFNTNHYRSALLAELSVFISQITSAEHISY